MKRSLNVGLVFIYSDCGKVSLLYKNVLLKCTLSLAMSCKFDLDKGVLFLPDLFALIIFIFSCLATYFDPALL